MPLPLLLAPLVSMLVDKGLDLAASAIDGGAEKAKEFIEEKTGVELDAKKGLSAKDIQVIKAMESDPKTKIKLQEMALEKLKEENRHVEVLEENKQEKYETAHESYKVHHEATDKLSYQIMKDNLIIIGVLVTMQILVVYFITNAALVATVSTLIGAIVNSLLSERQSVVNFRFGSSIGSKMKNLVKKDK